jgi:hypothetical protein
MIIVGKADSIVADQHGNIKDEVPCSECGAPVGTFCKTKTGRKSKHAHAQRTIASLPPEYQKMIEDAMKIGVI